MDISFLPTLMGIPNLSRLLHYREVKHLIIKFKQASDVTGDVATF